MQAEVISGLSSFSAMYSTNRDVLYPMFATHNAQTLATLLELSGGDHTFEFQRLHGMGAELYGEIVGPAELGFNCRV